MAEGGGEEQTNDARNGKPDVFISYASHDTAVANDVAAALEGQGLKCWIAPRDVTPGAHYASEIVHAIDSANAIVLILSQDAATSPHVLREIERATSKRHPVVTLRVDQAALSAEFEYFLNTSQWLDASGGDPTRMMPKLVAAVRLAIRRPVSPAPALSATSAAGTAALASRAPSGGARLRHRTAIVAGVVAAISIAGLVAYRSLQPAHRAVVSPAPTAAAMQATAPAAPTISEKSIAVLPFIDISEKRDQEYFSDGLSEELIDLLGRVPGLHVPARASSFYFKGKQSTLADIAKALNVTHVLEGSVRKSGDNLRITAELVHVADDTRVWSETFDRKLDDIFKVQDDIAGAVVLDYYERAVALDPGFAAGWAALGDLRADSYGTFRTPSYREVAFSAHAEAARALALDPNLPEAHTALGRIAYLVDLDWGVAQRELSRALELAPNQPVALRFLSYLGGTLGHDEQQRQYAERAIASDPLDYWNHFAAAFAHLCAGRLADAEMAYRKALSLNDRAGAIHAYLARLLVVRGRPMEALEEVNKEPAEAWRTLTLPIALDALGRKAEADAALERVTSRYGDQYAYQIALIYAVRNDRASAFKWLDRSYLQHDATPVYLRHDPLLKHLEGDPRYRDFLRKMNLPE